MSTPQIHAAVVKIAKASQLPPNFRCLDIGAGVGKLLSKLKAEFPQMQPDACDFHVERFDLPGVQVKTVHLDRDPLPYADNSFDLITCTEVFEHVENYRAILREMRRILKPGGRVIITTPNVLNALSRWRNVIVGFPNLFGPLPTKADNLFSTGRHITPIPYFYLAHAMLEADLKDIDLHMDRLSTTSLFWSVVFYPLMLIAWPFYISREKNRFRTVTAENYKHVARHLSPKLMLSRTLVVSAVK